ncbi:MAG: hypothetical protein NXI31_22320 [bacterium]|nr:hypothetical protein [bacterium]
MGELTTSHSHPDYPHGMDVEWLGIDGAGRIAIFTTAGDGPIPTAVLDAWSRHRALCDRLLAMPKLCGCELLVRMPWPDDYLAAALRGCYAFDWQSRTFGGGSGRYELQARPTRPLTVDDPRLGDSRLGDSRLGELGAALREGLRGETGVGYRLSGLDFTSRVLGALA